MKPSSIHDPPAIAQPALHVPLVLAGLALEPKGAEQTRHPSGHPQASLSRHEFPKHRIINKNKNDMPQKKQEKKSVEKLHSNFRTWDQHLQEGLTAIHLRIVKIRVYLDPSLMTPKKCVIALHDFSWSSHRWQQKNNSWLCMLALPTKINAINAWVFAGMFPANRRCWKQCPLCWDVPSSSNNTF